MLSLIYDLLSRDLYCSFDHNEILISRVEVGINRLQQVHGSKKGFRQRLENQRYCLW